LSLKQHIAVRHRDGSDVCKRLEDDGDKDVLESAAESGVGSPQQA
jgi:hypothetical protein